MKFSGDGITNWNSWPETIYENYSRVHLAGSARDQMRSYIVSCKAYFVLTVVLFFIRHLGPRNSFVLTVFVFRSGIQYRFYMKYGNDADKDSMDTISKLFYSKSDFLIHLDNKF